MATNFALTTKSRIKDRLQIVVDTFDTFFDRLILSVTARIETMCARHFEYATYNNELYDAVDEWGSPKNILILRNAPVGIVSSIEYKTGSNSNPVWVAFSVDDYDIDLRTGIVNFYRCMPVGRQNIRISYTAGYSGNSIGIDNVWVFNSTPSGTVNGVNTIFTLAEDADEVIVYADGLRIKASNYTFTEGTDTITFTNGQQPFSTISVDYKPTDTDTDSVDDLPFEIVEACEEIVVRIFKKRESEGRTSESFQESSINWNSTYFSEEDLATIKNYRRTCL